MNRILVIVAAGLIVVGAVVHGAATQRWSMFTPDPVRTERMHSLVIQHADCVMSEIPHDVPLKERSTATSRRYESAEGGFVAVTSIISGIPGAVATHTPDVCYTGNGYVIIRGPKRESVTLPNGEVATYFVADFERRRASSVERQRVRWTWTTGERWDAPDRARFAYMSAPELYKLYIVSGLPESSNEALPAGDTPAEQAFITATFQQFLETARSQ